MRAQAGRFLAPLALEPDQGRQDEGEPEVADLLPPLLGGGQDGGAACVIADTLSGSSRKRGRPLRPEAKGDGGRRGT